MSRIILSDEAERMAEELAALTGASPADALTSLLEKELARQKEVQRRIEVMEKIAAEVKALPVFDDRSPDEILGYNEHGHFD
ncbi:MAG TPA: type II toxin-antitoxin system VapB family antitoxin [Azospirillaceae bacterium]|nr:type II toxin-antitoxin system VapB family antitoxin [Azospirillaceae bacterium]